jgi:hypothetical protein
VGIDDGYLFDHKTHLSFLYPVNRIEFGP